MRGRAGAAAALLVLATAGSAPSGAAAQADAQVYRGLELRVVDVERTRIAQLNDCPPGANTQRGVTRPGEEFAIVTVHFRVRPDFQAWAIPRPVLTDAAGETYQTAVSFVDVGSTPEFSCQFPFRVATGTAVKSLGIEEATLELTAVESRSP